MTTLVANGRSKPRRSLAKEMLAAEQGIATGQLAMALRYLAGDGVEIDPKRAREYFELAAKQENDGKSSDDANYNLGLMHLFGIGVEPQPALALEIFLSQSDRHPESGFAAFECLSKGYGCDANPRKGFKFASRSLAILTQRVFDEQMRGTFALNGDFASRIGHIGSLQGVYVARYEFLRTTKYGWTEEMFARVERRFTSVQVRMGIAPAFASMLGRGLTNMLSDIGGPKEMAESLSGILTRAFLYEGLEDLGERLARHSNSFPGKAHHALIFGSLTPDDIVEEFKRTAAGLGQSGFSIPLMPSLVRSLRTTIERETPRNLSDEEIDRLDLDLAIKEYEGRLLGVPKKHANIFAVDMARLAVLYLERAASEVEVAKAIALAERATNLDTNVHCLAFLVTAIGNWAKSKNLPSRQRKAMVLRARRDLQQAAVSRLRAHPRRYFPLLAARLREEMTHMAESGFSEARAVLGMVLLENKSDSQSIDRGIDWLKLAANAGDQVASVALGYHFLDQGQVELATAAVRHSIGLVTGPRLEAFDIALARLGRFPYSKPMEEKLDSELVLFWERVASELERRKADREKAGHELQLQHAREDERRQMLSFLSHTLTSATSGASNTVAKIASKLACVGANDDLSDDAERLAAQVSRMAVVESLVEVFKLYTSDPKALREGWDRDTGGGFTVLQVSALAIRQALLRFYFATEHENDFLRLMPDADYVSVAREFMADALSLDMGTVEQAQQFIDWARLRLPFLQMSLAGTESMQIAQGGPRGIVIFALTGEFLGNALKYAAPGQAISLDIRAGINGLDLNCRNAMKETAAPPVFGGKAGLTFVRKVCELIGAEFDEPTVANNTFILHAVLPIK